MHSLDEISVEIMETLDMYLARMDKLQRIMRRGFMDLCVARNAVGVDRIGAGQFDQRMNANMRVYAFLILNVIARRIDEDACTIESLDAVVEEVKSGPRRRVGMQEMIASDIDVKQSRSEALRWFGVLTPPSLRSSQANFTSGMFNYHRLTKALQVIAELATLSAAIRTLRTKLEKSTTK